MPTVNVSSLIDRARNTLVDVTKQGWSDEELLDWFNAAQVAIITIRPDALVKKAKYLCDLDSRQLLPSEAIRLVRVDRNVNGSAIREIERDDLDQQIPDWHDDSYPSSDVEFYIFDAKEPRVFYLYPVPQSGHAISLVYSYAPQPVSASEYRLSTSVIAVEDSFQDAIYDYILFRALSKNSEYADGGNRAALHFQSFNAFLTGKTQSDAGLSSDGDA